MKSESFQGTPATSDSFYNRFTFLYPVVDLFLKPQKRKFFDLINAYPSGNLLEIGAGNGSHFSYYNRHRITGIDSSERMVSKAKLQGKEDIEVIQMSGEHLRFGNATFDYVVLSHVVAVVEDPERLLSEVFRVLKPGGKVFILNHFTPDNWMKYVDRLFEPLSGLLHFKSVFHLSSLRSIEVFKLLNEIKAAPFSYFKIFIYEKNS